MKKPSTWDKIEEYAFVHMDTMGYPTNILSRLIMNYINIDGNIRFRWHRIVCALKGCDEKTYHSNYLPDDCYEWECKRCGAEGINSQVQSAYDTFGGDDKIHDLIQALKGK